MPPSSLFSMAFPRYAVEVPGKWRRGAGLGLGECSAEDSYPGCPSLVCKPLLQLLSSSLLLGDLCLGSGEESFGVR